MSRRVLITGAGGFVGSHLAQGFAALGDRVVAVDRAFDADTLQRLGGIDLLEGDLLDSDAVALPGADLVIHAAAITTPPEGLGLSDAAHLAANVDLMRRVLHHAVISGAKDFVFISSSGVFSAEDGEGIHLESTTATASLPYAQAKLAGERAADAATVLRAISVRLGPIYGPHEAARETRTIVSPVRRWLDMALSGAPIVVDMPNERRDWTFAPDLPGALDALLRRQPTVRGVFHLTSGQVVSNIELAQKIAALVPSARIAIGATERVERRPMGSDRLELETLYDWTPLSRGLPQLIAEARA